MITIFTCLTCSIKRLLIYLSREKNRPIFQHQHFLFLFRNKQHWWERERASVRICETFYVLIVKLILFSCKIPRKRYIYTVCIQSHVRYKWINYLYEKIHTCWLFGGCTSSWWIAITNKNNNLHPVEEHIHVCALCLYESRLRDVYSSSSSFFFFQISINNKWFVDVVSAQFHTNHIDFHHHRVSVVSLLHNHLITWHKPFSATSNVK